MTFDLSPEQDAIRESIARFVAETYALPPAYADGGAAGRSWAAFAALGWLGVAVAEDHGGFGMGPAECALIATELGRGLADEPFLSTAVAAPPLLARSEAGAALLPAVAAGELRIALALFEPDRRYALEPMLTVARGGPAETVLTGAKAQVHDGGVADKFIVSAATSDGVGLFLVDRDSPGVSTIPYRTYEGREVVELVLDEVRPAAQLCRGDDAEQALDEVVDLLAVMQAAEAIGCMEAAIDLTNTHLHQRSQFGRHLSDFQVLQHGLADLFIETEMARSFVHAGLAGLIAGEAEPRRCAASAAKVAVLRAAERVTGACVHLHGAIGMTKEYPVGHFYRRTIAIEKMWGDIDFHLNRFGRSGEAGLADKRSGVPQPTVGPVRKRAADAFANANAGEAA